MGTPSDRLRRIRIERGFKTARAAAVRFGWQVSAYNHHENGTRPLTRAFKKYAKAYRVSEAWLRGLSEDKNSVVRGVQVVGEAAIGVWREADVEIVPQPAPKIIEVPSISEDLPDVRFSIRVADDSVSKSLPAGWYAICEPCNESVDDFTVGDMVYIERTRRDLREKSLRRVSAVSGDKLRLSTHSAQEKWKQPDLYCPANTGEKIRILGRVIGKYADYLPD